MQKAVTYAQAGDFRPASEYLFIPKIQRARKRRAYYSAEFKGFQKSLVKKIKIDNYN